MSCNSVVASISCLHFANCGIIGGIRSAFAIFWHKVVPISLHSLFSSQTSDSCAHFSQFDFLGFMDYISPITIISENDVKKYLPMRTCISLMSDLFAQVVAGKVGQPLRTFLPYVSFALSLNFSSSDTPTS